MAPRSPETLDDFIKRLRSAAAAGADQIRFGEHHHSHVVCRQDAAWAVRTLVCSTEAADAYMAEHGMFMPEHAEMLAEPANLVFQGSTLDELEEEFRARSWPLR